MEAVAFSGGKDSVAALCVVLERSPSAHVIHVDTGDGVETKMASIRWAKDQVGADRLHVVSTDSVAWRNEHGHPVDVLPEEATAFAQRSGLVAPLKLVLPVDCCFANISGPLIQEAFRLGVRVLHRGDKSCDTRLPEVRDGHDFNGLTIRFPIWEWADSKVMEFIKGRELPFGWYAPGLSHGTDCKTCTATFGMGHETVKACADQGSRAHIVSVLGTLREMLVRHIGVIDAITGGE